MTGNRERIDPELRAALDAVPEGPNGIFDLTDIPATRKAVREFAGQVASQMPDVPNVETEELRADLGGATPVTVRVHRPAARPGPHAVLIWFNRGGQILGYAEQDDPKLKQLAASVGCAVAAVEHRLAPENRSPAGAEDSVTAYRWLRANAKELGFDPTLIGISGASGGGCIAAAATLMIRGRELPVPLFQGLLYPMLDDRNETRSSREITDIGIWDRQTNIMAWRAILGDKADGADVSPYSAPTREQDVSRLPPTFLAVGELDVFRDEELDYAMRAQAAGTPTELHLFPNAYHAFSQVGLRATGKRSSSASSLASERVPPPGSRTLYRRLQLDPARRQGGLARHALRRRVRRGRGASRITITPDAGW